MTSIEKLEKYTPHNIKKPIDIASIDKSKFLFYLADRTPISRSDLAEECDSNNITSVLRDRFRAEIDIDMFDYIQLSKDARPQVIRASEPYLNCGNELLNHGKSLADDGELERAVECFTKAVLIFQLVSNCFDEVQCDSDELLELLDTAKRYHDIATKEVAKQIINQNINNIESHVAEGDELAEHDTSEAIDEYLIATVELSKAIDSAREYNKRLRHSKTSLLSIDPLKEKLNSVEDKLQTAENQSSELEWISSGSELRKAYDKIADLEKESVIELENAGYTSTSDLTETSKENLIQVNNIDHDIAEELLEYAKSDSEQTNERQATETSTLKTRLEEHYHQDKSDGENWYRCQRTTEKGDICNTKIYYSHKNRSDLRKHEEKHSASKDSKTTAESSVGPSENESNIEKNSQHNESSDVSLKQSAFENSWDTIPDNSRVEGQFLIKVKEIKDPRGDKKSSIITVNDREYNTIDIDIWETHDISIDWSEGVWYVLTNTRGNVWEDNSGKICKRLSSTKDLEVGLLGAGFDPEEKNRDREKKDAKHVDNRAEKDSTKESASEITRSGDEQTEDSQEAIEEDGIFDDIMSEFDQL